MSRAIWIGALYLLIACDDGSLRAFEPERLVLAGGAGRGPDAPAGAGGSGGGNASEGGGGVGAGGTGNAPDAGAGNAPDAGAGGSPSPLIIDDFEDGDIRANLPLGWWYPVNDGTGAQGFGIEPVSRGSDSVYALRTHGSGFRDWGSAVGVDLTHDGALLDLQSYQELCFFARIEPGNSTSLQVHLLRDTRHYTREVSLSETWSRYCLALTDFTGPNQVALVPNELIALQFFFEPTTPFEVWLDDVEIVRD